MNLSVVTLTRHRTAHLENLVAGLCRSEEMPHELVVVDMSETPTRLQDTPFPGLVLPLAGPELALASARNLAARVACGDALFFLDVDCIPSRSLLGDMRRILIEQDAIVCAEVRYLGLPTPHRHDDDDVLIQRAKPHPARTFPECGLRSESNYGLLWSTAFGIRRKTFDAIGGFDDAFVGYGAEDTDFGFRARRLGVPLLFLGGPVAFHQYHGVISPPVQHVADIVRNATIFYGRWGEWPMQDWLRAFDAIGLVAFDGKTLKHRRAATAQDISRATQPPTSYF